MSLALSLFGSGEIPCPITQDPTPIEHGTIPQSGAREHDPSGILCFVGHENLPRFYSYKTRVCLSDRPQSKTNTCDATSARRIQIIQKIRIHNYLRTIFAPNGLYRPNNLHSRFNRIYRTKTKRTRQCRVLFSHTGECVISSPPAVCPSFRQAAPAPSASAPWEPRRPEYRCGRTSRGPTPPRWEPD